MGVILKGEKRRLGGGRREKFDRGRKKCGDHPTPESPVLRRERGIKGAVYGEFNISCRILVPTSLTINFPAAGFWGGIRAVLWTGGRRRQVFPTTAKPRSAADRSISSPWPRTVNSSIPWQGGSWSGLAWPPPRHRRLSPVRVRFRFATSRMRRRTRRRCPSITKADWRRWGSST